MNQGAYDVWEKALLHESSFDGADEEKLKSLWRCHEIQMWELAERRWYGSMFLESVMAYRPEAAEPLKRAAGCVRKIHDLMWEISEVTGGQGESDSYLKLRDTKKRATIVELIRQAKQSDLAAAEYLERAADLTLWVSLGGRSDG